MHSISSTFLFDDTNYYFSYSESIDYHIGHIQQYPLQHTLDLLEQSKTPVSHLFSLFSSLFTQKQQLITVSDDAVSTLINNDGVKLLLSNLNRLLQRMGEKEGANLSNEMSLKVMMNILYICCDYLQRNPTYHASSAQLNQVYIDAKVDDLMMKMVTLSLQVHFIPVKKLTMLYTKILSNLFHHSKLPSKIIDPKTIYQTEEIVKLPNQNLIKTGDLQKLKQKESPISTNNNKDKITPVQSFYRKHNTGECPLAQSIVVGLLRSLLTICNCQTHKKFSTVKGGGVDSFREWQLSYRWVLDNPDQQSLLPPSILERLHIYQQFDQNPSTESIIWGQFYTHKIFTTAAITTFFFLLLVAFKQNQFMQYSYFLQLISDANGILVFLKFLTDKFISLESIIEEPVFTRKLQVDPSFGFKEKTMLTIYSVLLMLYASCNNYPEKIRNYLFQYNSYLIIKKIPALFMPKETKLRISFNKEEEQSQSAPSTLPSRKELEQLEKEKGGIGITILMQLTQLCFDLLKIQIPFFSKKMKENTTNMRLIIDLYCKFPKKTTPYTLSPLQKLLLKSKCQAKQQKYITSVQQMKTVHNEYNNIYYWSNDFLQEQKPPSVRLMAELEPMENPAEWLEENLWKYYD